VYYKELYLLWIRKEKWTPPPSLVHDNFVNFTPSEQTPKKGGGGSTKNPLNEVFLLRTPKLWFLQITQKWGVSIYNELCLNK